MEAPVSGSKKPAIDGQLIILAAGDERLFNDCKTAFDAMGKRRWGPGGQYGYGGYLQIVVTWAQRGRQVHRPLCKL